MTLKKRRDKPAQSLAYIIDGEPWCLVCTEAHVNASEYGDLFLVTARPVRVTAADTCPTCGEPVLREAAGLAAKRLAERISAKVEVSK